MAAATVAMSVPIQRRLAPDMKSRPDRIATITNEVPRSGCIRTRIHGGTRMSKPPMIVQGDLMEA